MKMSTKAALKAHMGKGAGAHPDSNLKKMARGGVTSANAKKFGRGMARVMNQRSPTK